METDGRNGPALNHRQLDYLFNDPLICTTSFSQGESIGGLWISQHQDSDTGIVIM